MSNKNNLRGNKELKKTEKSYKERKMIVNNELKREVLGRRYKSLYFYSSQSIPVMRQLIKLQVTGSSRFFRNIFKECICSFISVSAYGRPGALANVQIPT